MSIPCVRHSNPGQTTDPSNEMSTLTKHKVKRWQSLHTELLKKYLNYHQLPKTQRWWHGKYVHLYNVMHTTLLSLGNIHNTNVQ